MCLPGRASPCAALSNYVRPAPVRGSWARTSTVRTSGLPERRKLRHSASIAEGFSTLSADARADACFAVLFIVRGRSNLISNGFPS